MSDELILSHIARVRLPNAEREIQLRASLKERYGFEDDDSIFLWDAEISNDLLDSHYTHMNAKTLANYAADAERGVAFLKGHDWRSLPVGYSISGLLEEVKGKQRVVAGFYTARGILETDDLIKRMQVGLLRDVSVGFFGGRAICDLCGADFWDCRHYPGLKYEEKTGDTIKTELATFTIDDARLSEVSGVFDGSTPDAMILKAQRAAKAGILTVQEAQVLEGRYRVALPVTRSFPVAKEREMEVEQDLIKIRTLLKLKDEESIIQGIEALQQRVKELEPQAEEGRQYRVDLIKTALEEGVRAQGNEFDSALYEENLGRSSIAVIKRFTADWKKVADEKLKGGRASTETETREAVVVNGHIPDEAY